MNDPERRERRAARRVVKAVEDEPAVGVFEEGVREVAIELLGARLEALARKPVGERPAKATRRTRRARQCGEGAVSPHLVRWAEGLVREAVADGFAAWTEDFGCPVDLGEAEVEPELLQAGSEIAAMRLVSTLALARVVLTFAWLDGAGRNAARRFLRRQVYRRERSRARYELRFMAIFAPASLYVDALEEIDLADLLGAAGLLHFVVEVRRPAERTVSHLKALNEALLSDLGFDYLEGEIWLEIIPRSRASLEVLAEEMSEEAAEAAGLRAEARGELASSSRCL